MAAETEVVERQTLTPEQIAAQIVKEATETVLIEIVGTASQKLDVLAKYAKRDEMEFRGESHWTKNRDKFRREAVEELINNKHKAIAEYLEKKAENAKQELYKLLRSRGTPAAEADKIAFGS